MTSNGVIMNGQHLTWDQLNQPGQNLKVPFAVPVPSQSEMMARQAVPERITEESAEVIEDEVDADESCPPLYFPNLREAVQLCPKS